MTIGLFVGPEGIERVMSTGRSPEAISAFAKFVEFLGPEIAAFDQAVKDKVRELQEAAAKQE